MKPIALNSQPTTQTHQVFRGRRSARILFAVFGVLFCFFALLVQCAPYPDWSSRVLALLLMTLPGGAFGLYFLRSEWLLRKARVVVSDEGIALNIPNFKGGWFFRSAPVQLRWDEICCVQHERYALMPGGKPMDEYWIHSALGDFGLSKDICQDAAQVARLIAARKGYEFTEAVPEPVSKPVSFEQEEVELKQKATAVLVILSSLMFLVVLIVMAETAAGQLLLEGLHIVGHLAQFVSIVAFIASIFGLWWKARRERALLKQKINQLH